MRHNRHLSETDQPVYKHHKNRVAFPLTLITAGLVFLLINIGIIPTIYKSVFTAWPIWLILVGFFTLLHRNYGSGAVILTIGLFFMVPFVAEANPALGIPSNFTSLYWPLLLIVAGLLIFFNRFLFNKTYSFNHHFNPASSMETNDGFITIESRFESRKNIVLEPLFKGATIHCAFGETIIDLRKTNLAEGNTKIYVDLSFGSVVIIVPDTWNVQIRGNASFGSFSDHRLSKTYYPEETKKLTIEGKVAFGECEIRD